VQAVATAKAGYFGFDNQDGDSYFQNRYALRAHDAYDQAAAMRFALEHQNPLVGWMVTAPAGTSGPYPEKSFSLLSLADSSVVLWAAKPAEEGIDAGLILRVWNVDQVARNAQIRFHPSAAVQGAMKTSHIETDIGTIGVTRTRAGAKASATLFDPLPAQWMQTYRVKLQLPLDPQGGGSNQPPSPDHLGQNFPNPFNPNTTVAFVLGAREHVQLTVYDLRGRPVARLIDEVMDEGFHTVVFDAAVYRLPSGTYICRLKTPDTTDSRPMALVR